MKHRKIAWLSVVPVVILMLFIPVNVQVFAIETDSPLPLIDTLAFNVMVIKNLQLDNFTWITETKITTEDRTFFEQRSISTGQATLSMQVRNLTATYRVEFEISAKNVTVVYPDGRFHFDTLILKGYADLNERTVTVQAFKPMRIVDQLWGL